MPRDARVVEDEVVLVGAADREATVEQRALSDQRAHIPGHSPQDIVPARQSITLPFRGSPGPLRWSMAGTLTLKPKQAQQGFGR